MQSADGHRRVLITDGANPMRLLVADAATGRVLGNSTVRFDGDDGSPSQSEQSIAVSDTRAVVVQNHLTADRVSAFCMLPLGRLGLKLQFACPFLTNAMPDRGVQQWGGLSA